MLARVTCAKPRYYPESEQSESEQPYPSAQTEVKRGSAAMWMLVITCLLFPSPQAFTAPMSTASVAPETFYAIGDAERYQFRVFNLQDRFGHDWRIAGHWWSANADRMVVMVHGYADNCGYLKPLQLWFLQQRWDILCLELPGHGQSSGDRADIPDMLVYEDVYVNIFPELAEDAYEQLIFYGHSTANVGMIEYLMNQRSHPFTAIIMATPLVRSHHWWLSRVGNFLFGGLLDTVPRRNIAKQNPNYLALQQMDPDPIEQVPLHWFDQLVIWNIALKQDRRESQEPVAVLFAENDSIIDTRYNRQFLEQHFPNARYSVIPDADHILHFNQGDDLKLFYQALKNITASPRATQ